MPKRIDLTDEWRHSGIDITWTPSAQRLSFGGWYDSFVGLESHSFKLREFLMPLALQRKIAPRRSSLKPSSHLH
jgi:hypothetical protein